MKLALSPFSLIDIIHTSQIPTKSLFQVVERYKTKQSTEPSPRIVKTNKHELCVLKQNDCGGLGKDLTKN